MEIIARARAACPALPPTLAQAEDRAALDIDAANTIVHQRSRQN